MKAWFVFCDEWGELIHADTRGKAKMAVINEFGIDVVDNLMSLHSVRKPKLDDKPLTYQNTIDAGFPWVDEDGSPLKEEDFFNICKCAVCTGKPDEQA